MASDAFTCSGPRHRWNVVGLVAIVFSVLLSGCSLFEASFLLDNPGDTPIAVSIDGQRHALPANTGTTLHLAVGKHALTLPGGETVEFIVYADSEGGVINPTRGSYVLYDLVYATDGDAARRFSPMQDAIEIAGQTFAGPLQVRNGLFIDRKLEGWDVEPREAIPETLLVERTRAGNIQTKLFNAPEFLAYHASDPAIQSGVDPGHARTGLARRSDPPCPSGDPLVADVFTHSDVRAAAERIRTLLAEYRRSEAAPDHRRLHKEYHAALTTLLQAQVASGVASVEQNLCYNDFVHRSSAVIGAGVLIVE